MRRTRYLLLVIFSLSAFSLSSGLPAFSQDAPDVALGITPGTVYGVEDIDGVDMMTGRVNLHIPILVDHSQRGNLNFAYEVYNGGSGAWYVKCTNPTYDTGCSWYPGGNAIGGLTFAASGVLWPLRETERECCFGNTGTYYTFTVQTANDTAGASHQLGTVTATPYLAKSIDGSGIREVMDSNGQLSLTNKDGVQFHITGSGPLGSLIEDPNGNEITSNYMEFGYFRFNPGVNETMTDTLGRSWTWTETTNFSSCPVTAVDAYIWSTPGYSGGTRNFKFCLSTISISTNFHILLGSQYPIEYSSTRSLLTGIVLPDGTTWRFD
jgi:hypothetical protein